MLANCVSLQNIVIPNNVVLIKKWAFVGCDNLKIIVSDGNEHFRVVDNCLVENDTIIWGNKYSEFTYNNQIKRIGDYAFFAIGGITNITLQQNIVYIGEFAFSSLHKLENITIPNSVKYIGENAFKWCDKLQSITFEGKEKEWNLIEKSNLGKKLKVNMKGLLGRKTILVNTE